MKSNQDKKLEKILFEVYDKGVTREDCNLTDVIKEVKKALLMRTVKTKPKAKIFCLDCGCTLPNNYITPYCYGCR